MKVICEQMHRGAPHANTTGEREREREPVPALTNPGKTFVQSTKRAPANRDTRLGDLKENWFLLFSN